MQIARGLVERNLSGQISGEMISRHFIDVGARRVHYRKAGRGPPLLMAHQSPRSSAEYAPLMARWAERFTCIAPDTPGFGQSDPLAKPDPNIDDYADALIELLDALGIERTHAYGFHSGGIILVTALKRHPRRFHRLAVGGYAVWTPEEMRHFGESYIPPFRPSAYGEHLVWLWNRILEQSWFFPWFDARDATRLSMAHDDPLKVDAIVREMLDSGDAYRLGYGAVLRAPRDIPPPDAATPPVLITAYDGDPLQAHIDRLGAMPAGWEARKVATPAEHETASLAFLSAQDAPAVERLPEAADEGFQRVRAGEFDGLIHWAGTPGVSARLPAPGREIERGDRFAIDPPGHGLSDSWTATAPETWLEWQAILRAVGVERVDPAPPPPGDPARLYPNLSPDRFGCYLTRAWSIVRARALFSPWYEASAANALPVDAQALAPERLAIEHRALLRAPAARAYHIALQSRGE